MTDKTKEALKLALEALEQIDEAMPFPVAKFAQAAIREALALVNEVDQEQPAQRKPLTDEQKDAARYRFLAEECRSTSEHWGGRWSIVIEGPAPKTRDSEDDFDEAIDRAIEAKLKEKNT